MKNVKFHEETKDITELILKAGEKALREMNVEQEFEYTQPVEWPINCTVGPGLEGAIACESEIGYVNGSKGLLIYRGYDIFDLCANSTFEEVAYLLMFGKMPSYKQLEKFKNKLFEYMHIPDITRFLTSFPIEEIDPMAALQYGITLLRFKSIRGKKDYSVPSPSLLISTDDDSFPMETPARGESHAVYEFDESTTSNEKPEVAEHRAERVETCCHLIAGVASVTAGISRIREKHLPLEPLPELGHAGNLIYMMTGNIPSPVQERIMDICLIIHADHGMNASTFSALVVASTLSDMYFSIGSGIGALSGPLHGGANQKALEMLKEIGGPENVQSWYQKACEENIKFMGFGHRVYKTCDPRAKILGDLAGHLVEKDENMADVYRTAKTLEKELCSPPGGQKKLFP
ncbi:citrate/2-methylcitrate synthase, partial [bacterium]